MTDEADALWSIEESGLDLERLASAESVFALSNGHLGVRGTLDEGEPAGLAGTYLGGFHETRPLPYAEAWFGGPDEGDVVVPVADGTTVRLLVDDEQFEVRYGELLEHERRLDLRAGLLHRRARWRSPAGKSVTIRSTRLVSFTQRGVVAIEYEVEALDDMRVVLQSELVLHDDVGPMRSDDPRAPDAPDAPLVPEAHSGEDHWVMLAHRTRRSGLRVCAAMDHRFEGPETEAQLDVSPELGRLVLTARLRAGERLRLTKAVAYAWSGHRGLGSLRTQVRGAIAGAAREGFDGLVAEQRRYLDDFWTHADVELDGDPDLQRAVRFCLLGVLQASARAEGRAIAGKGLTGMGYDGHAFWDTEAYVLRVLTYVAPAAAAAALRWRVDCLGAAQARARQLGLAGAAFPWRTIAGRECSGYWPAGTAAFHINASIALAADRLVQATGDARLREEVAVPLLTETARLWRSLGHFGPDGCFHIRGVTGPDEYSALSDDNLYTNLMAARNLRAAAAAAPQDRDAAGWRASADAMFVAFNARLGTHEQSAGFLDLDTWAFEAMSAADYPLLLRHHYFDLYRKQVIKQADLTFALFACGDEFTAGEKARAFAAHEPLTVRDSSLSASIQAVVAAEVGHTELALAYLGEAAFMDLHDLEGNVGDGLHIASLAGAWLAVVAGFGGFRDEGGELRFRPRRPLALTRICFRLEVRGRCLRVTIAGGEAAYALQHGDPLELWHEDERLEVTLDAPVTRPLATLTAEPPIVQPAGREPRRGAVHHQSLIRRRAA